MCCSRLEIVFAHENETRILFGPCGMDSGTREVEVRLSPVEGHSGQERERDVWCERGGGVRGGERRGCCSAWLPL